MKNAKVRQDCFQCFVKTDTFGIKVPQYICDIVNTKEPLAMVCYDMVIQKSIHFVDRTLHVLLQNFSLSHLFGMKNCYTSRKQFKFPQIIKI